MTKDKNQYETMILQNAFYNANTLGFREKLLKEDGTPLELQIPAGVNYTLYLEDRKVEKVRLVVRKQMDKPLEQIDLEPLGVALKNWGINQQETEQSLDKLLNTINTTKTKKEKGSIGEYTYRYNKISEGLFEYIEYVVK